MVVTLGLVGIGVFGACLSALFCILAEATSCKVPSVVSLKDGLLRPACIIRSVDWTKRKIPLSSGEGELLWNMSQSSSKIRPVCRKRCWEIRKNLGYDSNTIRDFDRRERNGANDRAECDDPYNGEWKKDRMKKRRFILPKNLVIDTRMKNNDVANQKVCETIFSPELAELRFDGRYCYLEALRTKASKDVNKK